MTSKKKPTDNHIPYPRLSDDLNRTRKLTDKQREEIIFRYDTYGTDRQALADEYKVSYMTIYRLTCSDEVRALMKYNERKNDARKHERRKSDPAYRQHRRKIVRESVKYRRKVSTAFRKYGHKLTSRYKARRKHGN